MSRNTRVLINLIAICLLWGVVLFLPAPSFGQAVLAQPILPASPGPTCQLASIISSSSAVANQSTILCDYSRFSLNETDLGQRPDPPLRPYPYLCGGIPGESLSTAVVINGGSANVTPFNAVFDQDGCADLTDVQPLSGNSGEPIKPLALELVTIDARHEPDPLTRLGLVAVFFGFLALTSSWLWMLTSRIKSKR